MKDCIFCKIVTGEVPCHKIYEDDFCLAFLDISNDKYGHTLVIPKKHCESVMTCDGSTLSRVIETCKKIGNHYVNDCGFEGYNIFNNTGNAAEQTVMHMHFHVVPRKANDNVVLYAELKDCGADLAKVCKKLKFKEEKKRAVNDSKCVILYTDGACSGNPGAGGWASILSYKGKEKILTGGEANTTNNRMELLGVIAGLEAVKENCSVKVYSDSAYVVNAFNEGWIDKWLKNNWKTSGGKASVVNIDLWQRLLKVKENLNVQFIKVKGHSDDEINNRCDALAREEIAKIQRA